MARRAARGQHLDRRRHLRRGADHPGAGGAPGRAESPYGLSKFCAENYCALFTRLHGLSTISLRYGNVYGPRQDPLGEAGVIAIFCGKLLKGGRPEIFGDGRQTRDYVFVGDVVDANLRGAGSDATGAFNVGAASRRACSTSSTCSRGSRTTASRPTTRPPAAGEVQHIALDPSTRGRLGWEAQVDLEQGLARTLDSLR